MVEERPKMTCHRPHSRETNKLGGGLSVVGPDKQLGSASVGLRPLPQRLHADSALFPSSLAVEAGLTDTKSRPICYRDTSLGLASMLPKDTLHGKMADG